MRSHAGGKHCCEDRCYVCAAPTERERILVDMRTVLKMTGMSRGTIYRWMREGIIEWVILPLGRRRVYLDSLFREPPRPVDWIL